MASCKVEIKTNVYLQLSENEARFLMGLTQNYLGPIQENESKSERNMRETIFMSIRDALNTQYVKEMETKT